MIRGGPRIWPVVIFLLVALSLEVAPLPDSAAPWRPPWMALAVIYWSMRQPGRYGVGIAWLIGLLLDVLKGAVLGQHALALSAAAYVTIVLGAYVPLKMPAIALLVSTASSQISS